MRKARICLLLLAAAACLCACQSIGNVPERLEATAVPGVSDPQPQAEPPAGRQSNDSSVLWFRYGNQGMLTAESRIITHGLNEAYELALVRALVAGPDVRSAGLSGLFPEGTYVLSTSVSDRTLYVVFNEELLSGYADEPEDWASDSFWSRETPLRRQLCMQSLAATATENCDVDRVQVMIRTSSGETRRLPASYDPAAEMVDMPAELLWRDESLLLTPANTAGAVLAALAQRDWQTLYLYICSRSPDTGAARAEYGDFVTQMEQLPPLISWELEGGSVTESGGKTTFTLQGSVLGRGGQEEKLENRIFRLHRENGVWKTTVDLLRQAVEVRDE